jgi:hypothetical protein
MRLRTLISSFVGVLTVSLLAPGIAAAAIQRDSGAALNVDAPYAENQEITDLRTGSAFYGKLKGQPAVDIIKVRVTEDIEQDISLLVRADELVDDSSPTLLLVDKTDGTEPSEIRIPVPSEDYHVAAVKAVEGTIVHTEPFLLQQYRKAADQKIKFIKDTDYYFVVLDAGQTSRITSYVIRFGNEQTWTAGRFFGSFGSWFAVKSDIFGGNNPFSFSVELFGLMLFVLSLVALIGLFVVQSVFDFSAGKSKAAAFLSIKLQPFARWITWIGLWFMLMGGYIYAAQASWTGLIFALTFPVVVAVILNLVQSLKVAPALMRVEVAKAEANIPTKLRRNQFIVFVLMTLNYVALLGLLAMLIGVTK